MTVLEAVKQSKTLVFMYKDAIETAQAALTAPETVLWAHTGNVLLTMQPGDTEPVLKPGVTVVTSHRLLFANSVPGSRFTKSIALPDIGDLKPEPEGILTTLHIHAPAGKLAIQGNAATITALTTALNQAKESSKQLDAAQLEDFRVSVPVQQPEAPSDSISGEAAPKEVELEPYFQTYYPSRSRAARALHRDTGLDMQKCKQMVETYFSANLARVPIPKQEAVPELKHILSPEKAALEKRMKALDNQGIAYCPKCASTSISVRKRGFSAGKAIAASFFLSTEASLVAGAVGANKTQCFCMKCGHTWKP